jgi:hypothetical protein
LPIGKGGLFCMNDAEQGLQAGWEGVDAAGGTPLRISKPPMGCGTLSRSGDADAGMLPNQGRGVSGPVPGEALPEIKPCLTSPTGGAQGLGFRRKRGLSGTIRGN